MYNYNMQPVPDQTKLNLAKDKNLVKIQMNSVIEEADRIKLLENEPSFINSVLDWLEPMFETLISCFNENRARVEYVESVQYHQKRLLNSIRKPMQTGWFQSRGDILADIDSIVSILKAMLESVGITENNSSLTQIEKASIGDMNNNKGRNIFIVHGHDDEMKEASARFVEKEGIKGDMNNDNKGRKVFIVHGHDDGMKEAVARFVENIEHEAVILHEQANGGQVTFEKLKSNAQKVSFAIVLLSPDDKGYSIKDGAGKEQSRARQNVVFEHGYFCAMLGSGNVVALYKKSDDFEMPSDLHGILYINFDSEGHWKHLIAREMDAAGLDVDQNKITKSPRH